MLKLSLPFNSKTILIIPGTCPAGFVHTGITFEVYPPTIWNFFHAARCITKFLASNTYERVHKYQPPKWQIVVDICTFLK